jgi:coenzyme F420-reducing hydrogenase gamma subunit
MKPRVAFFEFSSCEGCQLEALNLEPEELLDLVSAVDIVNFREAMTERADDYDIAFVEGSITRDSEILRLQKIRNQAKIVVAFGACACIGGINCLKNHVPMEEGLKIVYGDAAKYYDTIPARPIDAVVKVDYYVRGCPPITAELLKVVKALLMNTTPDIPNYPVCTDCKMAGNVCVFERGMTCMGPVTRAGCNALCVTSGRVCWGCRGLVDNPNIDSEKSVLAKYGLTPEQVIEEFKIYDTYAEVKQSD